LTEQWADPGLLSEGPAVGQVLARAAGLHRRAAVILRANGMRGEAARAEQYAIRTRLMLDEPKATRQMQVLTARLYEAQHRQLLLERALEGALSLIGGELGNVQVCDWPGGSLRIAAQCGFSSEFLEYFAIVGDDTSACGRAASQCSQTVIVDVNEDAAFAIHREIAAAARFRAVQSTPAVDQTGRLRAVISTHYRHRHRPSERDLELVSWYAEHVGAALAQVTNEPTSIHETTAMVHAQTADLHHAAAARLNARARSLIRAGYEARALTKREWAREALDRARQERERAQALAERAQNGQRYRLP
jgi:GAF domain-containing protein